jgi:hypothetical protein
MSRPDQSGPTSIPQTIGRTSHALWCGWPFHPNHQRAQKGKGIHEQRNHTGRLGSQSTSARPQHLPLPMMSDRRAVAERKRADEAAAKSLEVARARARQAPLVMVRVFWCVWWCCSSGFGLAGPGASKVPRWSEAKTGSPESAQIRLTWTASGLDFAASP